MTLRGVISPVVTQIDPHGRIDREAMSQHGEWLARAGVRALFVLGTMGEAPWLSEAQCRELLDWAGEALPGRIPFWMGTPPYTSMPALLNWMERVARSGAAAVVLTPPTGELPQDLRFFRTAGALGIPLVLYNIPPRTGYDLSVDYLQRIVEEVPAIVALKQSSGRVMALEESIATLKQVRPTFAVFTGWDPLLLSALAVGGDGVVSTISNFAPEPVLALYRLLRDNWCPGIARLQHQIAGMEAALGAAPDLRTYVALVKQILSWRCRRCSPRLVNDEGVVSGELGAGARAAFRNLLAVVGAGPCGETWGPIRNRASAERVGARCASRPSELIP